MGHHPNQTEQLEVVTMARQATSSWSILFVLLSSSCIAMATQPSSPPKQLLVNLPIPYFSLISPTLLQDPTIKQCSSSLDKVPGCTSDVFASFLSARVQLGAGCCNVIGSIGDRCVQLIFPFIPLNPWFGILVRGFCSALPAGGGSAPPLPSSLHDGFNN